MFWRAAPPPSPAPLSPAIRFSVANLNPCSLPCRAGFEKPSAIQQRAILPITSGRDVIAQAQSGTGKTSMISVALIQQLDTATRECAAQVLLRYRLPVSWRIAAGRPLTSTDIVRGSCQLMQCVLRQCVVLLPSTGRPSSDVGALAVAWCSNKQHRRGGRQRGHEL